MRNSFSIAIAVAILGSSIGGATALAQEEAELSRSERRELRRAEREAERAAAQEAREAAQSQADAQVQADARDDEGLICRRESVTGTHRRVRICTTAAQREAMRNASTEVIRDISRNRGVLGPEGQ